MFTVLFVYPVMFDVSCGAFNGHLVLWTCIALSAAFRGMGDDDHPSENGWLKTG